MIRLLVNDSFTAQKFIYWGRIEPGWNNMTEDEEKLVSFRAAVWVYMTWKDLRNGRNIQVM
jgi:hypothetical protein